MHWPQDDDGLSSWCLAVRFTHLLLWSSLLSIASCGPSSPPVGMSSQAISLPTGFEDSTFVTQVSSPTSAIFAADGRLFICEKAGRLRVVKNGSLLSTPFL